MLSIPIPDPGSESSSPELTPSAEVTVKSFVSPVPDKVVNSCPGRAPEVTSASELSMKSHNICISERLAGPVSVVWVRQNVQHEAQHLLQPKHAFVVVESKFTTDTHRQLWDEDGFFSFTYAEATLKLEFPVIPKRKSLIETLLLFYPKLTLHELRHAKSSDHQMSNQNEREWD